LLRSHAKVKSFLLGKFTQTMQKFLFAEDGIIQKFDVVQCSFWRMLCTMWFIIVMSFHCSLLPKPSCEDFITLEFLEMIADDLAVATRPPMASLGSAREATYAARFLHWTAAYPFVL